VARKKVVRKLPPLPKLRAFDVKEHKTELLLETLRHIASATQEERQRVFYSMREVASRFRAPISTIADVYQRLEREGMLRRIRGSKTVLRGLRHDRKLSVRAFVGLPTMTSTYVTVQDYRMFLMLLRRELRLNGFAAAMLDIDQYEADKFAERVRKYEIDTIVWFQPRALAKQAGLQLKDLGLRIVGISDGTQPSLPCFYEVHREAAIRNILRTWRSEAGIKSAIVVTGKGLASVIDERRLEEILKKEGLKYEIRRVSSASISKLLKSLSQRENIGIVFLSSAASMFAFRSPELVTEIFQRCRIALIEGPVNTPFAEVPGVRIDLVLVDWQSVAERIVGDLIAQIPFDANKPVVFEAESRLRVPLNQYAQAI
jgi:hypothetical protein